MSITVITQNYAELELIDICPCDCICDGRLHRKAAECKYRQGQALEFECCKRWWSCNTTSTHTDSWALQVIRLFYDAISLSENYYDIFLQCNPKVSGKKEMAHSVFC